MPKAIPRTGGPLRSTEEAARHFTRQRLADPTFEAPPGYEWDGSSYRRDTHGFGQDFAKWLGRGAAYGAPIIGGGIALAGLGGAAGATGAASSAGAGGAIPSIPFSLPSTFGPIGGAATAGTTSGAGATGMGGFFGRLFGRNGIDPTAAVLGGLSLFGDDPDPFQKREGYSGAADPNQTLGAALTAIQNLLGQVGSRPGFRAGNSVVNGRPAPINVPGIPFQIGGGLATDPALGDPSLLMGPTPLKNPFGQAQSGPPQGARPNEAATGGVRRRTPGRQ